MKDGPKNESVPVRIDAELYAEAGSAALIQSRSKAQQLAHWARIGKELEASPKVSIQDVEKVLSREKSYDELRIEEQAVVRASWSERMNRMRERLDLEQDFLSAGKAWVELDEHGHVIRRGPEAQESPNSPNSET